jgi:vancomycin aglycone glucosyltransferase
MRVLLSTYGGRGDVEPLVGLAVRLRALGAEVRVCAPPDCAQRLAEVGVALVPVGPPVRELLHGATPPTVADVPRRAAELIAEQFDKLPAVAQGCDVLVATGLFPVAASVQSVAEKLGIRYVFAAYCPIFLPSPHRPPHPLPGRPLPPDVTDSRVLNRRRGQPAGAVRPGGRRRAPWRRGHDDDGRSGGRASGGGAPDC